MSLPYSSSLPACAQSIAQAGREDEYDNDNEDEDDNEDIYEYEDVMGSNSKNDNKSDMDIDIDVDGNKDEVSGFEERIQVASVASRSMNKLLHSSQHSHMGDVDKGPYQESQEEIMKKKKEGKRKTIKRGFALLRFLDKNITDLLNERKNEKITTGAAQAPSRTLLHGFRSLFSSESRNSSNFFIFSFI